MTNPVIAFCTYFLGMLVAYLFFFKHFWTETLRCSFIGDRYDHFWNWNLYKLVFRK